MLLNICLLKLSKRGHKDKLGKWIVTLIDYYSYDTNVMNINSINEFKNPKELQLMWAHLHQSRAGHSCFGMVSYAVEIT